MLARAVLAAALAAAAWARPEVSVDTLLGEQPALEQRVASMCARTDEEVAADRASVPSAPPGFGSMAECVACQYIALRVLREPGNSTACSRRVENRKAACEAEEARVRRNTKRNR